MHGAAVVSLSYPPKAKARSKDASQLANLDISHEIPQDTTYSSSHCRVLLPRIVISRISKLMDGASKLNKCAHMDSASHECQIKEGYEEGRWRAAWMPPLDYNVGKC
ncbi:hypothetical protein Vretimale_12113 [Volvox reticuliferus]|uniref:Uncharacterized protein n=1 Tax=Volvox reticuliferus TaxID=1737510 RepID=A0A8J4CER5_9CHLO|nr:hypothetical protein Vretifemale_9498 [Volvox reticuliferus]GIM08061.1 hypothetical protein Vretimale_12113 [Volvox reticuliferus]